MGYAEAITADDRQYVKKYILLLLVIAAYERDCQHIEANLKTPGPYVDTIKLAVDRALEEMKEIKKYFRTKGLKVYEQTNTESGIRAKFMCRGYRSEMELRWEFITAEASVLMRKYLGLDISKYEGHTPDGNKK
jgi:hypothetical protein